jgi:hypothetical protein
MRAAPPVSVRCSGGLWWRGLQTVLPALAAAACGVWALQWAQLPPAWAAVPAFFLALLSWRRAAPQPVDLVWDGVRWSADSQFGQLDVMLDAGTALLLRLRPQQGRRHRWIAVTAAEAGAAMHGLRVAAYHRVPEPAAPEAPEASAGPAAR